MVMYKKFYRKYINITRKFRIKLHPFNLSIFQFIQIILIKYIYLSSQSSIYYNMQLILIQISKKSEKSKESKESKILIKTETEIISNNGVILLLTIINKILIIK